jgi:hypothetical protein
VASGRDIVGAVDGGGRSALWFSLHGGHTECAALLLHAGADDSAADVAASPVASSTLADARQLAVKLQAASSSVAAKPGHSDPAGAVAAAQPAVTAPPAVYFPVPVQHFSPYLVPMYVPAPLAHRHVPVAPPPLPPTPSSPRAPATASTAAVPQS